MNRVLDRLDKLLDNLVELKALTEKPFTVKEDMLWIELERIVHRFPKD